MERLEAALEKARQQRQSAQRADFPRAANLRGAAGSVQHSHASQAAWDALPSARLAPRLARKNRISTLSQSSASAPYDLLRTRTLRIMSENGWHTLAVTSPNKACGKTTVSVNLAFSIARQEDLRVMALDLDLRRPAMHKLLAHRTEHSLHEVLAGKAEPETALLRFGENIAFGLNKVPAENPSELLQSKRTHARLQEIRARFAPDIIIYDMPPMLMSDENFGFLPQVDCGLLIGAADSTTITQLDICEKEVADLTNVLGVVLNKCRFAESDSGYDYEYY